MSDWADKMAHEFSVEYPLDDFGPPGLCETGLVDEEVAAFFRKHCIPISRMKGLVTREYVFEWLEKLGYDADRVPDQQEGSAILGAAARWRDDD